MRRPSLRLVAFALFFLATLLGTCLAREPPAQAVTPQDPSPDDRAQAESDAWAEPAPKAGEEETEPEWVQRQEVQDAVAILRKIKPPTASKLARLVQRPKGILGHAAYYAKEAFVLLFLNAPEQTHLLSTSTTESSTKPLPALLGKAVKLLEDVANEDDPDALFLLAEMNFYGNFSHPVDYDEAFRRYKQLADLEGNSTAQYMLGFMYATGLAPSVPANQAKSMLYHTFAADGGNTRSQMTLGYRHHAAIATPRNCDEAVHWYKMVADKAVDYYRSGPPGGHVLAREVYRIADEEGGVFGEGASVSSAGHNAKQGGPTSDAYADVEDVLEYLHLQSGKGDLKATFGLARLHYDGARGLKRDLRTAKTYFMEVAREAWTEKGKLKKDVAPATEKLASRAAGYLGRMFLRGEGMEQSFSKAKIWFNRGLSNGDALSQYSLGLMYLEGLGGQQDVPKAANYLAAAADQDLAVAQTKMGILFLDQGDTATATQYFELATRNSHIEAFYYLAEMNNHAVGRQRSCGVAAAYYKIVVEKAEAVWSSLVEAAEAYEDGDTQRAFVDYLMAAEQGSENAQANVAWLLDQSKPRWSPLSWLASARRAAGAAVADAALALVHWTRSAKQHNVDSLVKMGDYYFFGLGTAASVENAVACYQAAAETQVMAAQSAQALWNLGWMHENGVGIAQDFHLAKRFYDQALETNREAYLPVQLSLFKLRWRSWWNGLTRGGVHGIEDEPAAAQKSRTFAEWLNDFLEADAAYYNDMYEADDWDASQDPMPGGDEYWDGGGEADDLDDGFLETLLIGSLVAALGWLIYYRRQQQAVAERRRRQRLEEQGPQQHHDDGVAVEPEPDRGLFPEPGNPAWNDWVAGGVGH